MQGIILASNAVEVAIGAGIITAIVSLFVGKRQMYVDTVVKKRLDSIEERRHTLKELYLYTNPEFLARISDGEAYIEELIKLQSSLEYRLMDNLHPDSEILKCVRTFVDETISMIKGNYRQGDIEWFSNYENAPSYRTEREKCLRTLKIYNFASWEYIQKQSRGTKANSVKKFNKVLDKTLEELEKASQLKVNKKQTAWARMMGLAEQNRE